MKRFFQIWYENSNLVCLLPVLFLFLSLEYRRSFCLTIVQTKFVYKKQTNKIFSEEFKKKTNITNICFSQVPVNLWHMLSSIFLYKRSYNSYLTSKKGRWKNRKKKKTLFPKAGSVSKTFLRQIHKMLKRRSIFSVIEKMSFEYI